MTRTFGSVDDIEPQLRVQAIPLAEPGTRLHIDCRGKLVEAEVVKGPFYKRRPS